MIGQLNSQQQGAFSRMSREFASVYTGGLPQFINDVLASLASGATGITSTGVDIDSLALGGGAFTVDPDATSGLTLALKAGRLRLPSGVLAVAAASLALSASLVNYVEVDGSGTLSSNTSGFTAGRCPLYQVTTGTSTIATIANAKALLALIPAGSVGGSLMSAAGATRTLAKDVGSISATAHVLVAAPVAGKLSAAVLLADSAAAASDSDYWTFALSNLGQANAGTAALLSVANSTKVTAGQAIAARVAHPLTLTTVVSGTELNVATNDVLLFTATATGSPPALTSLSLQLSFTFSN